MTKNVIVERAPWIVRAEDDPQSLITREWLATNGLGGYASGTVAGVATRRYHGLLVAALPAPWGRMVMLNHLAEEARVSGGRVFTLGNEEVPDQPWRNQAPLTEFRFQFGLPIWVYETESFRLEKRLWLLHHQNTVFIQYRLTRSEGRVRLRLRPSVHFRPHENAVGGDFAHPYMVNVIEDRFEICTADVPRLRFELECAGRALVLDGGRYREYAYRLEQSRGYDWRGRLWSPGYLRTDLEAGEAATLVASTEEWATMQSITPDDALRAEEQRRARLLTQAGTSVQYGVIAELVLAADQFLISPVGRATDAARARAEGDETRSVIAGYHWFTDWGRDTMISLEGLTLSTGQALDAGRILRTFANHVRDGLLPNLFPEGQQQGLYHTADATLWYFHAIHRYLRYTRDRETLRVLLPVLRDIVAHHLRGTRFNIHIDPRDGLLSQGAEGYQLTWMDAKVDGWVVTPRRGKAVELNALWYNALRLMERWLFEEGDLAAANECESHADRAFESFNARFWNPERNFLFDVIDGPEGNDSRCRPNQIFAISLDHPILAPQYWKAVLDTATDRLLTPMGLRSLAPGESDYKPQYYGDLRARDAAYHQGTVWAWLIGPFVDAWLRVHQGDVATVRAFLEGFEDHLGEAGIGSISEIFDAEAPYTPRGCIAQAWSVAEVLRAWLRTIPADTCTSERGA